MTALPKFLLIALLAWSAAAGATTEIRAAVETGATTAVADGKARLTAFLDGLHTLQAEFEQAVLDTENNTTGLFRGVFRLSRPGKFRWDYEVPYEQSIIADGRDLWIVDPELRQITQQWQRSALKGTPALLLAEDVEVESQFEVVELGERQGLEWLELTPRDPDAQFVQVLLAFEGNALQRMEMADKFGQISRFRFYELVRNPKLDPKVFNFEKPPGYDMFTH